MDHVEQSENVREEEGSANGLNGDSDIALSDELLNDKALHDENRKEKEQLVDNVKDKLEPRVGMEFDDDEQAYQFYNDYARRVGFSIRKQHLTKNKSGQVTFRRFVCYREGYYRNRPFDKEAKILRTDGRTGCNAHIGIKRLKSGKFCVHRFEQEHNHKLASSKKVHLLRSQRQADESQISRTHAAIMAGSAPKPTLDLLCNTVAPSKSKNYFHGFRQHEMKLGDAGAMLHYLQKKAAEDQRFFSSIQLDMRDQITNVFWADSRSKIDYEHFGDVLCLDVTYKPNGYDKPFVQFLGVNHHMQTVIFGAAFLYADAIESFKWLFESFKEAMDGRVPQLVLTDEDAAIVKAMEEIWPNTAYRRCVWHIYINAIKNLSHVFQATPSFTTDLSKCLYDCEDEDEFMSEWERMLTQYNLTTNVWLSKLFEDRTKWALIYGREIFSADIKSALRSEHMHPILKTHLNAEKDLMSFFKVYERLVEDRRYNELQADVHANQSMLEVPLSRLLKQVASIYTPKVYEMFVKEFKLYVDCVIQNCAGDGNHYEVTNLEKQTKSYVRYDPAEDTLKCSCKKFEAIGILCSHVMKVLDYKNIKEIPEKYIMKRWRKDVKDGILIHKYDSSNEIDPTVAIANRYASLGQVYLHIMAKGAKCQQAYEIALEEAQKITTKLDHCLQNRAFDMSPSQSSEDQLQDLVEVHGLQANNEDGRMTNQGTNSYRNNIKQRRRRKVISTEERIINKRGRKGQPDDVLPGSPVSTPMRIQPHLAISSNQYDSWPSVRCLSLQYPSTGQETLVSNPSQPPFGIINQLHQNESTCIMFTQSPVGSTFTAEPSER
ncbi:protein FAR1-RELATED SEQUENCE 5-like isoform X1 [Canna indica]|uniref:Protein FAR1-RELATED SEQUENCE n=1 Tax=Canna indica TaxID=4628 RepID=A0AAQ3Q974_9LILI|nr:protein FAR1-RELATED SEQUENCE 5-like isoform X1 [Canna indica]